MQVEYKIGDLCLISLFNEKPLIEMEILDICVKPPLIKTRNGWEKAEDFHKKVLCKLGHYELRGWWIFKRRVFLKE